MSDMMTFPATDKNVGTNDDCISRRSAIDAVTDELDMIDHVPQWVFDRLEERLKQLTPAQPKQRLDEWCDSCKEYDTERHCCPRWNKVIRQALADVQPEQRWIPVTERPPEERHHNDSNYVDPSDSVLVFTRYKTYYISRYWGHRITKGETSYEIPDWMDLDDYISDAVVAWMPLPEPWKGEPK